MTDYIAAEIETDNLADQFEISTPGATGRHADLGAEAACLPVARDVERESDSIPIEQALATIRSVALSS